MDFKLEFDVSKFINQKLDPRAEFAQKWLDNEVLKDCGPYVPVRSGDLFRSGITATKIGSGKVEYNMPYARRVYYGNHIKFNNKQPKSCAFWFEKAKGVNKDKWLGGVKKIFHDD